MTTTSRVGFPPQWRRRRGGGVIEYERSVFLSPVGRVLAVVAAVVARERFDLSGVGW